MWCPMYVCYPSRGGNRIMKTRETYLVKRRSIQDLDVSRFTFHERRT